MVAEAVTKINNDVATLLQSALPMFENIKLQGKIIRIDNNTVIHINGNMTSQEATQLVKGVIQYFYLIVWL